MDSRFRGNDIDGDKNPPRPSFAKGGRRVKTMKKSASEILLPKTYKEIWKRGEEYADRDRVEIDRKKTDDKILVARVRGKNKYRVVLKFAGNGIKKQCNCAYSEGGPPSRPACKHMVAAAISWDENRRIERPSRKDIDSHTLAPPPISRQGIINLFKNPLKADLDKLRILVEYSSSVPQPHARLPNSPKIRGDARKALKISEIKKAFLEMEKWTKRSLYDPYFCAGEMSAAFCELLDVIKKRMIKTEIKEMLAIILVCVDWFYKKFNQRVDIIEGVWLFPAVRIGNILSILLKKYPRNMEWQEFNKLIKKIGMNVGKKELSGKIIAGWKGERLKINN
jgi:hypothetical protein